MKTLSWHLNGGTEENHRNVAEHWLLGKIRIATTRIQMCATPVMCGHTPLYMNLNGLRSHYYILNITASKTLH